MMANDGAMCETKSRYDVFLSFRGEDTRHTFTCHLNNALRRKGISTFMDDGELELGDPIGPKLLTAIEESNNSIIVLSENYADSSWCLDELVKILECKESKNQLVWPIFYKVDPSYVRCQKGSYDEAMTKHEKKLGKDSEKVQKWRSTLTAIANMTGKHLEQGIDESKFIDDLVSKIFLKVSPKELSSDEHIVGREDRVEELKSLLHKSPWLGIHGTGGIGKTTLAKALYDSIYKQFEGSCFLFNVRETSKQKGIEFLQQRLLSDILEDSKIQLGSKEEGTQTINLRLTSKRVLIVLDDVDDIEQLKNLAGSGFSFGDGSRIIVTTRDKHLLDQDTINNRYEVKELNGQESLELFCQSAFRKSCPETNYEDLSNRAISCCKGLPLALKVLGSHMIGKGLLGWKDALDRYEKSPHPGVQEVLRISYDNLPPNEKNIFLDIACFFKGQRLEYVKSVLDACDFHSGDGIDTLVNKSLLTVESQNKCLEMHDLIQDMGKEIVKEEAGNDIGERSRLWFHKDVLQVLVDDMGSSKIQGLMLDPPQREEINCTGTVFKNMKNLRILIVRNTSFSLEPSFLPNSLRLLDWKNYPSQSFPSSGKNGAFNLSRIGAFNLSRSPLLLLKEPFKKFQDLTYMNISYCDMVTEFPDVSGAENLRELRLDGCKKLVTIHKSVGLLANLVFLSASECTLLTSFVPTIYLPSLEYLSLNLCTKLAFFPEISGTMNNKLKINMLHTAINVLPESIEKLTGLNYLEMTDCEELQHLSSSLFMLPNFVTLKIGGCRRLRESFIMFEGRHSVCPKLETLHFDNAYLSDKDVRMIIYHFPNLKDLNISCNTFMCLPACIKESTKLTSLQVRYCDLLQEIPALPSSVQKVDAKYGGSLTLESSDVLWSQVLKEVKSLEVVMPKSEIPEWFHHISAEGFPVFDARKKFPAVVLALVFGEVHAKAERKTMAGPWRTVGMHLFIEGKRRRYHSFSVAKNHVLLFDLRVLLSLEEWEDVGFGVGEDWKTIEVSCDTNLSLCSWGVYVYETETKMEDIKFMSQDPSSSLVQRDKMISDLFKIRSKKSLKLPRMYREYKKWNSKGEISQVSDKAWRRVMALSEGEGRSGMNIEDERDKEVDSLLDTLAMAELDKNYAYRETREPEEREESTPSPVKRKKNRVKETTGCFFWVFAIFGSFCLRGSAGVVE